MKYLANIIAACILTLTVHHARAEETRTYQLGKLTISNPTARATVPGASVGGGYVMIINKGKEDDRLISVSTDFSKMVQIHSMKMENGVMMMQQLADGLPIPAGATVRLAPSGNHIMFMKLQSQLKVSESHKVTLIFEKAGSINVTFKVKSLAETMKMKMN